MSEEEKESHIALMQAGIEANQAKLDDFEATHKTLVNSNLPSAHTAGAIAISTDNINHVKNVILKLRKGIVFLNKFEARRIEWNDVVAEMEGTEL